MQWPEPSEYTDSIARRTIDAALAVHRELGPGFPELAYENALCLELEARRLAFERQFEVDVVYRAALIANFRLDLVVENALVVELECVNAFTDAHFAQVTAYLRATRLELGLLLNFAASGLITRRVVFTGGKPSSRWKAP